MINEKKLELPASWVTASLRSLIDAHYGKSLTGKERTASGRYPVVGSSGVVGMHDEKLVDGPCIVVGRKGSVGATYLLSTSSWPIDTTYYIQTTQGLELRYLYYLLGSLELVRLDKSTTIPSLSREDLYRVQIPIAPTQEQVRIVETIEELLSDLDTAVAELKAAQKKLAQYGQSLLKAAVDGVLTSEWRKQNRPSESGEQLLKRILAERRSRWEANRLAKFKEQGKIPPKGWQSKYPEPVQPDTRDLPELPEGWVWASVDQCALDEAAITDGPFGSNLKSSHYQDSGPRVIRLQNIGDGVFIDARAHISEKHYSELEKHSVEENDLVIAMLGEMLPRACLIPEGISPAIVKADCARVRLNTNLIMPSILVSQLNSKPVRDIVVKFVKGIGRPRINLGHIRAIPVALCPMEEQRQINSVLRHATDSIDQQLVSIEHSLNQSNAQHKNILKTAFSGQLVPQDPNDGSAAELLEHIHAERAERERQPTPRKTRKQREIAAVVSKLIDVLAEASDWLPAQEAFRRCGVVEGTDTDRIEELYAELRGLDKDKRLKYERHGDFDMIKLNGE